tara:strand:- start:34 stop:399 length:366 start_codon:yes stop_codon:yes gene_type:complete
MSSISTTYFTENKKQIADIKREFRNSLDSEHYTLDLRSNDFDFDFSSTNYHINTQGEYESEQDSVRVRANLILDDRFTLNIDSRNDYFDKHNTFCLFMDNEVRLQIIDALSNVVVHSPEDE